MPDGSLLTMTCKYCGTQYEVPAGYHAAIESTRDLPPPARCAAWAVLDGERLPRWKEGPRPLHYCERGVAKEWRI